MRLDIRRFDIYRKVPKDLTQPTLTGACISIACVTFITFMLCESFYRFLNVEVSSYLFVEDPAKLQDGNILVNLNATLPHMGCEYLGLDIQDQMGRHEVGFVENTVKLDLPDGGCQFNAKFRINKVPGNFHLSTHGAKKQPEEPDMRHRVDGLVFGEDSTDFAQHGTFNALKGKDFREGSSSGQSSHEYVLKIVPSEYESISGDSTYAYQYTYAHKEFLAMHPSGRIVPAIWFKYDLTPITVKYSEKRQPIYTFLTSVCAIVGGTFTVAGILDSLVFTASEFWKKMEIGKQS